MPVNGYSIDLCYLFVEKSSIDPRGIRRTCYPMHVFYPYAMIWLPVLADNKKLEGIKEWEQGFNKEKFLKKGRYKPPSYQRKESN